MLSAVFEFDTGSNHQFLDRARHQDLSRLRHRHDPGADVHAYPTDFCVSDLDLPGVEAGANVQSHAQQPVPDGEGAANGPGRAVEGGEHPVAGGPYQPAAGFVEPSSHEVVVRVHQLTPAPIAT